jgi:hypothetical protein
MQSVPPEEVGPAIARLLAPLVAAELAKLPSHNDAAPGQEYDAGTCAKYVAELGTGVLNRAHDFFTKLDVDGQVGSLELAQQLAIDTPRNIPANLTNSLKQRARAMGLERPWRETVSADDRTVWVDRDGIAELMIEAVRAEQQRRFGPQTSGAAPNGN